MRVSFVSLAFCLLLASVREMQAGWVYETEHELSTQGDWNGDAIPDMFVVDRAAGTLRVGLCGTGSAITWLEAVPTGVVDVTGIAYGEFSDFTTPFPGLAVTTPLLNRIHVMQYGRAEPLAFGNTGIGPEGLVTLNGGPAVSGGNLINFSVMNAPPDVLQIGQDQGLSTIAAPGRLARGNEIDSGLYAFVGRNPNNLGFDSMQFFEAPSSFDVSPPFAEITSVRAGSDWAYGRFDFSSSEISCFLWVRGQAGLNVRFVDPYATPPVLASAFLYDLGKPLENVTVLPDTLSPRLLICFEGGTSAAVYDYDGINAPVLAHTLTPEPGQTFRHAMPWGFGDFHLFSGPAGSPASTSVRRWVRQPDGSYAGETPVDMTPRLPGTLTPRANVLLYQGEPFVDENAGIVGVLGARDWTASVTGLPGGIEAAAETFQGSPGGLGILQNVSLGASRLGPTHALPNQIAGDVSMVVYSPPVGQVVPAIEFSPPPGRYSAAIGVTFNGAGLTYAHYIRYRIGGAGAWQYFYPGTSSPIQVTADTTIQAYIDRYARDRTPILTGAYTIGSSPAGPVTGTDADGNGLGDEWEDYFGIHNPAVDDDQDGFTNKQEHDAQTDPGDPGSHPGQGPGSPQLLLTSVSPGTGLVTLRLYGDPGRLHQVEFSLSLSASSWQPVGNEFSMPAQRFVDVEDTSAPGQRRFYRAKAR